MHAFKSLGKSKPTEGLGLQLEDLARAATKKTLPAPDDELIQEVPLLAFWGRCWLWQCFTCPYSMPRKDCALDKTTTRM